MYGALCPPPVSLTDAERHVLEMARDAAPHPLTGKSLVRCDVKHPGIEVCRSLAARGLLRHEGGETRGLPPNERYVAAFSLTDAGRDAL